MVAYFTEISLLFSNSGLNPVIARFIRTQWCSAGEARRTDGLVLSRSNSAIKWLEYEEPLVVLVSYPILVLIMKLRLHLWASFRQDRMQSLDIPWINGYQFDLKDCNSIN